MARTMGGARMEAAARSGRNDAGARGGRGRARTRSTFMVEALLILACLMMVLAVVMGLFGFSYQKGLVAQEQQRAQMLAQNAAERFAADPQAAAAGALAYQEDGLAVSVAVTEEAHAAGCLLEATITVSRDDEVLVTLDTARYVRDGEAAAAGSGGSTVAAAGSAAAGGNGASGDAGAATPGAAERRVE